MNKLLPAFFLSFLTATSCLHAHGQTQNDFDGDAKSDVTYYSSVGVDLYWKATGSTSAVDELQNRKFGIGTDGFVPGHWLSALSPNLGVVRLDTKQTHIVWKVLDDAGSLKQITFGNANDLVVSGGDYDGDGITDAATVRIFKKQKQLRWYIVRNMFSATPTKVKSYNLGVPGDRTFFMNYDGTADWLAAFGLAGKKKARLVLRNIITKKTKTIRWFPATLARGDRPRPFPIAQIDGTDLIGFAINDATDTNIVVYNTTPDKLVDVTYPGLGTVFVGDYLPGEPGEEIAFQTGSQISYLNPITLARSSVTAVAGTPVDEINFAQLYGPTPTPTATFTPTPTPTSTVAPTGNP